ASPGRIAPVELLGQRVKTHVGLPLARIAPEHGASAIARALSDPPDDRFPILPERYLFPAFLERLCDGSQNSTNVCCPVVDSLSLEGLDPIDIDEATDRIDDIVKLLAMLERGAPDAFADVLLSRSLDPPRTKQFLTSVQAGRVNYADLGGYP